MPKMILLLFLLCSGFSHFAFASNHLRHFRYPQKRTLGNAALKACNQTDEKLVTLYDEEDAIFTDSFLKNQTASVEEGEGMPVEAWLGLHRGHDITWSDGTAFDVSESPVQETNRFPICEAMVNNTRTGFDCSEEMFFMCYKDNNYTLIQNNKTWCKALQHCKKHYTNLVSISNETQNDNVIEEGKNTSFWIGVMHDEWSWQDKSCSSFRKWEEGSRAQQSGDIKECTSTVSLSQQIKEFGCESERESFCSKGLMRIRVINESMTWEDALDYCKAEHTALLMIYDKEDQEAVEQWLRFSKVTGQYWIGLRQSRVFGFWIWRDRTVSESNWKDDRQPLLPMSHPCGFIDSTDYKWSDRACSEKLPFICEEEIVFME